ncbi:MAG: bifunctional diguanylate cyclase/phosphodiesterase [Patulibacter sp.]|nr:bifunctional diguanylate cyclase/phosphodiesterase [Patulibacter sp.]
MTRRYELRAGTAPGSATAVVRSLAFVLIGLLLAVAGGFAFFGPLGSADLAHSSWMRILEVTVGVCAVVGLLMPRASDAADPAGRRARWIAAGVGLAVMAVFVALADLRTHSGRMSGPIGADLMELLVAPLAVAALMTIVRARDDAWDVLRVLIDGAVIAGSAVIFGWYVAVRPLRDSGGAVDLSPSVAVSILVVDAVAFAFGLLLLSRTRPGDRAIVSVGVVGLALLLSLAHLARIAPVLLEEPGSGALSELGWIASLACFAAAAWMVPSVGAAPTRAVATGSWWWQALPYTFLLPVSIVLVVASYRQDGDPLMGVAAAAIIAVLGVRQVVVRQRNEVLTGQLRRSVQQLARRARHDELTGLLNRGGLVDELEALQGPRGLAATGPVTALFIDVDRFKGVNDALGHSVGDTVLRVIGSRIGGWVDEVGGIAARIAGDEFIVVLPGLGSETAALSRAQDVLDLVEAPIPIGARGELIVTASAGVAVSTDLGSDDAIIRHADLAMLEAKSGGRARVRLFEEDLRQRCEDRMLIEQELRRALAGDHEIEVHLQPLARLGDGSLWGAEALVRWRHPIRGMLSPSRFLDVAEESGLIIPLGERVLASACAAAAAMPGLVVAVNLSPRQLHDPALAPVVRRQLRRQGLAPERLCLEVTEGALVDDRAIAVLEDLRRGGVQVAIDDFGVGASSFRQLRRLPGALVKIDRSFIERIDEDAGSDDRVLVRAMVNLAEQLGLQVIAEGIERESQRQIVRRLGVTIGQGWHLGAPTRAAVFVADRGGGVMLQTPGADQSIVAGRERSHRTREC